MILLRQFAGKNQVLEDDDEDENEFSTWELGVKGLSRHEILGPSKRGRHRAGLPDQ
jgi:hypothetical protein